jgi:hypothetical protein
MFELATAGADLSAERQEHRFLIAPARAQRLARALGARLAPHRFRGASANTLPRPHHFVTTVYFDTPSRQAFAAATAGGSSPRHSKLRARQYYDLHPGLAELATDPRQMLRPAAALWLELKFRDGSCTGKRRLDVPQELVPGILSGAPTIQPRCDPEVLREIRAFCSGWGEPLAADCLVHYRRLPWQDEDAALRVTMDVGVEFFAPPAELWRRGQALTRARLGRTKGKLEGAIIELKCRSAPPSWLLDLLAAAGAEPTRLSKFEEASRAVHAVPD